MWLLSPIQSNEWLLGAANRSSSKCHVEIDSSGLALFRTQRNTSRTEKAVQSRMKMKERNVTGASVTKLVLRLSKNLLKIKIFPSLQKSLIENKEVIS